MASTPAHGDAPRVSVVMPLYNAGEYVAETVRAVLDQTWTDLELVVVDDGSTDDGVDVVRSLDDGRIRLLHADHGGEGAARNIGLQAARGELLVWNDADDVPLARRVERMVAAMADGVDFVHHDLLLIDGEGRQVGYQQGSNIAPDHVLPHFLRESFPVNNNSLMLRLAAVGDQRYAEHVKIGVDSDFMRRFAPHHVGVHLPEPLLMYRKHSTSMLATMAKDDDYPQLERLLELEPLELLVPDAFQADWPDDGLAVAHAVVALCLTRREYHDQGARYAELATADPLTPAASVAVLAVLDLVVGDPLRALARLETCLVNSFTAVLRGDALALLGQHADAARVYELAVRLNPGSYDAITGLRAMAQNFWIRDLDQRRPRLVPWLEDAARFAALPA